MAAVAVHLLDGDHRLHALLPEIERLFAGFLAGLETGGGPGPQ